MGLSYHYSLRADREVGAEELRRFLEGVEMLAANLGFSPNIVFAGPFDSPERREFARRTLRGKTVVSEKLRNCSFGPSSVWRHAGNMCMLAPEEGVCLVLTDEKGIESVFGFLKFPSKLLDSSGHTVLTVDDTGWEFGSFVDSPDPRYRQIVDVFREAGFFESDLDEWERGRRIAGLKPPPHPSKIHR